MDLTEDQRREIHATLVKCAVLRDRLLRLEGALRVLADEQPPPYDRQLLHLADDLAVLTR